MIPKALSGIVGRIAIAALGVLIPILIVFALSWTAKVDAKIVKVRDDADAKIDRVRTYVGAITPELASLKATTQEQHKAVTKQLNSIDGKLDRMARGRRR